jgi:esterase/lipase superfamily enzyme
MPRIDKSLVRTCAIGAFNAATLVWVLIQLVATVVSAITELIIG